MTATADRLKRDPEARTLALYPAKALIRDQLAKWEKALKPLGVTPEYIYGEPYSESERLVKRLV
jgi:ATP-dependent helicase YprA (DUF1998 family)